MLSNADTSKTKYNAFAARKKLTDEIYKHRSENMSNKSGQSALLGVGGNVKDV